MHDVDELPPLAAVPVPAAGQSGIVDRKQLAAVERYAREVQLQLAGGQYDRAHAVIERCKRDRRRDELLGGDRALVDVVENTPHHMRLLNALDEQHGIITVRHFLTASPTILVHTPGTSPAAMIGLAQHVLSKLVSDEKR